MARKYPKEVIEKVDELLKQGLTSPQVAEMLGLPRVETISGWIKKYGIGKPKDGPSSIPNSKIKASSYITPTPGSSVQTQKYSTGHKQKTGPLVEKSLKVWLSVQDILLERLNILDFKSAEGIIQGLEVTEKCISHLACLQETFTEESGEINKETVNQSSPIIDILNGNKADVSSENPKE